MRNQGRVALALAVVAVAGLLAIAVADARPLRAAGKGLWGHAFRGVAVEDDRGKRPPFADVRDIHLGFSRLRTKRGVQHWIGWKANCNGYGARVRVKPSRLEIWQVASTSMACSPARRMREDAWLADFFHGNPHWRLRGKRLTLTSGPKTLRLRER